VNNITTHHVSLPELNPLLAQDIAQRLETAIHARGFAVLSVSGGKSPIGLFEALRVINLDWSRVRITLVDERCVPDTHTDSNAWLVRNHLLKDSAAAAQFIPMASNVEQVSNAAHALKAVETTDVLILGMGPDGHTASLFPTDSNLIMALDMNNTQACVVANPKPLPVNAPYPRITQTLAQILSARHIALPVTGTDKLQTLQQAQNAITPNLPVSYVLHQTQTPVALWLANN
jgi:6-phosphogluconolactonase